MLSCLFFVCFGNLLATCTGNFEKGLTLYIDMYIINLLLKNLWQQNAQKASKLYVQIT